MARDLVESSRYVRRSVRSIASACEGTARRESECFWIKKIYPHLPRRDSSRPSSLGVRRPTGLGPNIVQDFGSPRGSHRSWRWCILIAAMSKRSIHASWSQVALYCNACETAGGITSTASEQSNSFFRLKRQEMFHSLVELGGSGPNHYILPALADSKAPQWGS